MPTATKTAPVRAVAEVAAPEDKSIHVGETTITVDVRPIEPKGKLIGFASVTIGALGGNMIIPDFKIYNGETGLFVNPPSVRDENSRSGWRETTRLYGNDLKNLINVVVRDAYVEKVQQLEARAAAAKGIELQPARIKEQLAQAGKEAAQHNAARPVPEKPAPAHDDR